MIAQARIDYARKTLTDFMIRRAARLAKDIGFSYEPAEIAPDTFELLKAEYRECMLHRRAFRVWSGASDKTIYTSAEGNYAFRFIHDVIHASKNLDFTLAGELATGAYQIKEIIEAFGADSLECQLITLDTKGQIEYFQEHNEFPADQLAWTISKLV